MQAICLVDSTKAKANAGFFASLEDDRGKTGNGKGNCNSNGNGKNEGERAMKSVLNQVVSSPVGAALVLVLAAALEVFGDSFFQSGLYRSSGTARTLWFVLGVVVLGFYGLFVNLPQWDFGRLLGAYVALFFVVAQVVAKVRFHQSPTMPILLGGGLIVVGGLVITFWKG